MSAVIAKTQYDQREKRATFVLNQQVICLYRRVRACVCHNLKLCFLGLFLADAPVSKSGQGYSGAPRIQRQEQVIHISPKKGSQVRLYTCLLYLLS